MMIRLGCIAFCLVGTTFVSAEQETLPSLRPEQTLDSFEKMWSGFDPRAEPLETEVLKEWEEEDVVIRVVRFRIGVFKGSKATMAAVYGFPKSSNQRLPGLLQIHGGGQYADHKACLMNAKRGYATLSIAWAGRISATNYRVGPDQVKLFWDKKTDDPQYRLTTDWGELDGYHAPSRNRGNQFPSANTANWTFDQVESPRNSGWFLCALAARRALTFLERQSEVDPNRLGVYGHSMGGKLTVMASVDPRVKAAAPSCGGISDRDNDSELFRKSLGDDVSLKKISCPIVFLSPSNDFHGRIGDLPSAVDEITSDQWRVTCSPHHNHQDTAEYEVATLLWFDQHLKDQFRFPATPQTALNLAGDDGVPTLTVRPDLSRTIESVDVFYTQQGKADETPKDRLITMHRFWHHAAAKKESDGRWVAKMPVADTSEPLWAYANVVYSLDETVSGAGYYYGRYDADFFNVSSLLQTATADDMQVVGTKATLKPTMLIEDFAEGWQKQWFHYREGEWARTTHKIFDPTWKAPPNASLSLDVRCEQPNKLVITIDDHCVELQLKGNNQWQTLVISPEDLKDHSGTGLPDWNEAKRLKLSHAETLRGGRGTDAAPKKFGGVWQGRDPEFRLLRWDTSGNPSRPD